MKVNGVSLRPLRPLPDGRGIEVIDQRRLPFELQMRPLRSSMGMPCTPSASARSSVEVGIAT